jgi:hypothetical protein
VQNLIERALFVLGKEVTEFVHRQFGSERFLDHGMERSSAGHFVRSPEIPIRKASRTTIRTDVLIIAGLARISNRRKIKNIAHSTEMKKPGQLTGFFSPSIF